jgi:hypothetical protein
MNNLRTPDYADFQMWVRQLALKIHQIEAELDYAAATDYCKDCPRRDAESGLTCCRETGEWDERYEADFQYIDLAKTAQTALKALIPDDESG